MEMGTCTNMRTPFISPLGIGFALRHCTLFPSFEESNGVGVVIEIPNHARRHFGGGSIEWYRREFHQVEGCHLLVHDKLDPESLA